MKTNNNIPNTDFKTLVFKACTEVHGFEELYRRLERRMHTQRRSESTKNNYARHLAQITLHYKCLPTVLADDQIEDYLEGLILKGAPSESYFKHTVYGLRYLFRLEGLNDKRVVLPSIKHDKKLPIVLSRDEVKAMLKHAELLKHKLLVGLLYGCGLRCGEVYAKKPFSGANSVVEYLGRYTHKVAISNHRITAIDNVNNTVTFNYKDYKANGIKKQLTLNAMEFVRRFSLHILPKVFVRIRH